jgi:hypothetical protein
MTLADRLKELAKTTIFSLEDLRRQTWVIDTLGEQRAFGIIKRGAYLAAQLNTSLDLGVQTAFNREIEIECERIINEELKNSKGGSS